jgi:glycosyltransferase involved in cell wall biosynthesis
MLNQLPSPPTGKSGWPWTEESETLPAVQPDNTPWPRISIVTPSFNQGKYIEETIRSILLQNYPNLEYIIIDGGSTDETVSIIEKYKEFITYRVSEPDNGQSQAINKGFMKCTGEFVNWICSDDLLCRNAFTKIAPIIAAQKDILLLGSGYRIDERSEVIDTIKSSAINEFNMLVDLRKFWRDGNSIIQQSTLYPLAAIKQAGLLAENNYYTMDFELWGKLMMMHIPVVRTEIAIGMFRWYGGQKTSNQKDVTRSLIMTTRQLILSNNDNGARVKLLQLLRVSRYEFFYNYGLFRSFIGIRRRLKRLIHG